MQINRGAKSLYQAIYPSMYYVGMRLCPATKTPEETDTCHKDSSVAVQ